MATKLTKAKAVAGVLAGGALLCGLIFAAGQLHSEKDPPPETENVATNDDRVAYLSAWGWEVAPSAVETLELRLPESLDASYEAYNELQREAGLDLTPYCGKRVKRYTYTVLNHPAGEQAVQANLYLCENTVVAGDILSPGTNGFIASLRCER